MATTGSVDVLVDTSVFIDFLRGREPAYRILKKLLEQDRIRLAELVMAELLQGSRSCREVRGVRKLARTCRPVLAAPGSWGRAGHLSRLARRGGRAVGLADCYLAVLAKQNGLPLYTLDGHFPILERHLNFELFQAEAV